MLKKEVTPYVARHWHQDKREEEGEIQGRGREVMLCVWRSL